MKQIAPYLNFEGNCREAMTFYSSSLGGEVSFMTFADSKMDAPKGSENKIMHSTMTKHGLTLMASDTLPGMDFVKGNNCAVILGCSDAKEAETVFAALSVKGKTTHPLTETFWASRFGMFTDQFGVNWIVNADK